MKKLIVDIDGTIADCSHRQPLLREQPRRWDEYHALCHLDTPYEHIRELLWGLAHRGYWPDYITGRMERSRVATERWINHHSFPLGPIFMRPENDHRDDTEIKAEAAFKAGRMPDNTLLVLEDRDRVVKMWREMGFKCLQVAEGAF